jgi:hypothetical protein
LGQGLRHHQCQVTDAGLGRGEPPNPITGHEAAARRWDRDWISTSSGWKIAHLPLYTSWRDAGKGFMAFAVFHCLLGDLLISAVISC